jgi:hypothetical protein
MGIPRPVVTNHRSNKLGVFEPLYLFEMREPNI